MKERFIRLWNGINVCGNPETEFSELERSYSRPNRFYHTLKHIENSLVELDSARHLSNNQNLIEFALWYHDAKDDEEESAQLAYGVCRRARLSDEFSKGVIDLIWATKHNTIISSIDEKILVDVDLVILGKPVQEFDEYERNIRKEYSWVVEDKFQEGRTSILQRFLDRNSIYYTDFFREKYEEQARENLKRSIEKLRNNP